MVPDRGGISVAGLPGKVLPYALGVLGVGTVATLAVLLFCSRRALRQLQEEEMEDEYCAEKKLMAGYGNKLFGPNDPVTPAVACTVVLRYLDCPASQ